LSSSSYEWVAIKLLWGEMADELLFRVPPHHSPQHVLACLLLGLLAL
jgi:hypothetical protein